MSETTKLNEPANPWSRAKQIVKAMGDLSRSFTIAVRGLSNDPEDLRPATRLNLERIFCSPSLVAHFYYAALAYHPVATKDKRLRASDLPSIFERRELAVLVFIAYCARRINRQLEGHDSENFICALQQYTDLGIHLGRGLSAVGTPRAILVGTVRQLAFGIIQSADPKGMKRYRVQNKVKEIPFDLAEEEAMWGTTHVHLGATLMQQFGFGVDIVRDYFEGMMASAENLTTDQRSFRVAALWIDSLIQFGRPPADTLGDDYQISETHEEDFIETIHLAIEQGGKDGWLSKRKGDLGEHKTPHLDFRFTNGRSHRKKQASDDDDDLPMDSSDEFDAETIEE